ncbi:MAG: hypothetical protein RLZ23_984 [Actinomycetota bacterium]|jgi:hypothetical protein
MTEAKKGRPTPKRKDAQVKQHTLAPVVTKEEKKRSREASKRARIAAREAYMRGDENALPARDKGPVRRYVREFIDSRRSVGEFFLPIVFFVLILTVASPVKQVDGKVVTSPAQYLAIYIMWGVLAVAIIDGIIVGRLIKKNVKAKFPDAPTKGLAMYGWLRSTQMRKMRSPKAAPRTSKKKSA